jgi:hypothetical protein
MLILHPWMKKRFSKKGRPDICGQAVAVAAVRTRKYYHNIHRLIILLL